MPAQTHSGNCSHGTARFHGLFLSRHGTARGHNPRLYHSTARHGELLLHFTGLHGRKPCGKRQHPSVLWPVKPSECMARHGRDNYSHCTAFHGTGCLHYKTSRHGTALHGRFLEMWSQTPFLARNDVWSQKWILGLQKLSSGPKHEKLSLEIVQSFGILET